MDDSSLFTIKDLIINGNQNPDHNAIESYGYQPLTYRDFRMQILYVVKTLNGMGFNKNDRIAVIMPAGPETAVINISVMAGFTSVPLNPQSKKDEFETYFSQLKVKAIIVLKDSETDATLVAKSHNIPIIELLPVTSQAGKFELISNVPYNTKEAEFSTLSDVAVVVLTSGTTSRSKIVPISQKQFFLARQRNYQTLNITNTDRYLHILPYYHAMGIAAPLDLLLVGGTVICSKEFIPSDFPYQLETFRPTYYTAGPALHQGILRAIKKVSPDELKNKSLRFITSASASLPPDVLHELETLLGVPVIDSFATSETGIVSINFPPKRGSVGIPVIECLKILDENGDSVGPYVQGEIVVKGGTVFRGYEDAPDENEAAFMEGWFKTGDIGYLDDEGYLFYTGRKKELINKGGEKISPSEIDAVIQSYPRVREAMTFRIDDPALGEDIAAMVVPANESISEEELRTYLLDRLIQFKVPRRIYFVDEIPKGPTGKLLRYTGTERYNTGKFENAQTPVLTNDTISQELYLNQEKLMQIWKDILDIESLSPEDDFFRCGGNSLAAIELLIRIQREFHTNFPADTIYRYPTIRDQAVLITEKAETTAQYHPLIVPIHGDGTLPPLFCFHPVDGWIGQYQTIAPFLDPSRPVFGIRARGLEPTEKPFLTVEEAVREYIDAIKTVQKEGPYHLLGYSAGAIYAFELACQLQSEGKSVAFLGIIDASIPLPQIRLFRRITYIFPKGLGNWVIIMTGLRLYRLSRNHLKIHADSMFYSLFIKAVKVCSQGLLYLTGSNLLSASRLDDQFVFDGEKDFISTFPEEQQPFVRTQIRAIQNYQPRTFSGNFALFSTGPDPEFPGDLTRGWNSCITGKTIVIDIPGSHGTLFNEPFDNVVAQKIEDSLKRVDAHG